VDRLPQIREPSGTLDHRIDLELHRSRCKEIEQAFGDRARFLEGGVAIAAFLTLSHMSP